MLRRVGLPLLAAALAFPACARPLLKAGEQYEIIKSYETAQTASDGSSSTSSGRDIVQMRVIAQKNDGFELEYDLPKAAKREDRDRQWQFPLRVFKPWSGPLRLLDRKKLEPRIDRWLKASKITRESCGRWIFTWNAFRIDCDPESALRVIEALDISLIDLEDGAPFTDPDALRSQPLRKSATGDGFAFKAALEIDPDRVRRSRAEAQVAVGDITQEPKTLDAALAEQAGSTISGTIDISFETDRAGQVLRRTRVAKTETRKRDGVVQQDTVIETVERKRLERKSR